MIKLASLLQQSQQTLYHFVKDNINNPQLLPLITDAEVLLKVPIELTEVQESPFFIKHVFNIIRKPNSNEKDVLGNFLKSSQDSNINKLIEILLNEQNNIKLKSFKQLLGQIDICLYNQDYKQVKSLVKQEADAAFKPCLYLIQLLLDCSEDNNLSNNKFKQMLLCSIDDAFLSLFKFQQDQQLYLNIISSLLNRKIIDSSSQVMMLVLLYKITQKHNQKAKYLIKTINHFRNKAQFTTFLSSAIFSIFVNHFKTQFYFNSQKITTFKQLTNIAMQFYTLLCQDMDLSQLGWLAILSIKKWLNNQNIQDPYFKCVSILREQYFQASQMISEVLIQTISEVIDVSIGQFMDNLQIVVSALTHKQIKYLFLKLEQVLPADIKRQIIKEVSGYKRQYKRLAALAYHLYGSLIRTKEEHEQYLHLRQVYGQDWKLISRQIQCSSYNSLQKQLQIFTAGNILIISSQLQGSKLEHQSSFHSTLAFYANLLQNNYFAQQYWLNQQKIQTINSSTEPITIKINVLTDYINSKQIYNLSIMMIINQLLKQLLTLPNQQITAPTVKLINAFVQLAGTTLQTDMFPSNVLICLQFLLLVTKLDFQIQQTEKILSLIASANMKVLLKKKDYSKIHYITQLLILSLLEQLNQLQQLHKYSTFLTFYREFIKADSTAFELNQYSSQIYQTYHKYSLLPNKLNYHLRQIEARRQVKNIICHRLKLQDMKYNIDQGCKSFTFQSPIFKGQIVVLSYIAHSPEDNYNFKNHFIPFLYQEYSRLISIALEKIEDGEVQNMVYSIAYEYLKDVLDGDTFSHGVTFYYNLNKAQISYILLSINNLIKFGPKLIRQIIYICLKIIEKDNYPLLRQYIQLVLGRAYMALNRLQPQNQMRKHLIASIKVNVNIGVPIILTLGYQLIDCLRFPQKYSSTAVEILSIHQLMLKFISCHTAYLRAICQYYLYLYLHLQTSTDPFLENIKHFWSEDKDSLKIFKNVSIIVQGFRNGLEKQCDFLGFERVEEYPSNRVKLQYYSNIVTFYNQNILNQIDRDESISVVFHRALEQASIQRYQFVNRQYLRLLNSYLGDVSQRTMKDNMKSKINDEIVVKPAKQVKIQHKQKGKSKQRNKKQQVKNSEVVQQKVILEPIFWLENQYLQFQQINRLSHWYRSNVNPKIIIIATLLQKVHNFGHILRTLHQKNAMIVVPSNIPLLHQQCKELVPKDCDVQIVQIKHRDLQKYIILMKNLGYPLVALQQCSRSVTVQQAKFPDRFMLLLGNERIGAPASLLNEADLLVQIPQIGKIRSLNVHVSMVICLWEYLIKQ